MADRKKIKDIIVEISKDFLNLIKEEEKIEISHHVSYPQGIAYSGFNQLILTKIAKEKCYYSAKWITYKKAKASKIKIKNLKEYAPIFFWSIVYLFEDIKGNEIRITENDFETAKEKALEKAGCNVEFIKKYPVCKYYRVYNLSNTDKEEVDQSMFEKNFSIDTVFEAIEEWDKEAKNMYENKLGRLILRGCERNFNLLPEDIEIIDYWIDKLNDTPYCLFHISNKVFKILRKVALKEKKAA